MNNLSKLSCAVCLAAAATLQAAAQTNGSNSPYSRYGFGLLAEGGNAFNKAMAGTAYGMADGKELNTLIPSYAQLAGIKIYKEEFEKTPKKSIKRFLYVDAEV